MSNGPFIVPLSARGGKRQQKRGGETKRNLICKLIQSILIVVLAADNLALFLQRNNKFSINLRSHSKSKSSVLSKEHIRILTKDLGVVNVESDTAYLNHCDLSLVPTKDFLAFRDAIAQELFRKHGNLLSNVDVDDEITLQTLEMYSRSIQACNFSQYQPSLARYYHTEQDEYQKMFKEAKQIVDNLASPPTDEVSNVFLISAFEDFPQLEHLIQSITLPQHLIIIHLERRADQDFTQHVQKLAESQSNILLMQFGSVVYPSDSLSHIFLDIMRFVTNELDIDYYDYLITLGSTAFPLREAHDMARYLKSNPKRIRLGQMHHPTPKLLALRHAQSFGITLSRGDDDNNKMLITMDDWDQTVANKNAFLPPRMDECNVKTNSGNTAAFPRESVASLLESPDAMAFLSRFKQAGGCCNEELSWGCALSLLGEKEKKEVVETGMMWQAWPCNGTMRNSQLRSSEKCVKVYDNGGTNGYPRVVQGNDAMKQEFREARDRGHLFARKFRSDDPYYMDWIVASLHSEAKQETAVAETAVTTAAAPVATISTASSSYAVLMRSFRPSHPDALGLGPISMATFPTEVLNDIVNYNMSWLEMRKTGSYGISRGQVPAQAHPFMQYYGRRNGWSHTWTHELVETMVQAVRAGQDVSCNDYPDSAWQVRTALDRLIPRVENHAINVLVAGSISPWLEAIVLAHPNLRLMENRITTADPIPLEINDARIKFAHMEELKTAATSPEYDLVLSYSSIEHDGLGRYGDPVNPRGDLAAMAEYHTMMKEGGYLVLAVPVVPMDEQKGIVQANWHRIYSIERLQRLWCGFDVIGERIDPPSMPISSDGHRHLRVPWEYQPVFILQKTKTHACYSEVLPGPI